MELPAQARRLPGSRRIAYRKPRHAMRRCSKAYPDLGHSALKSSLSPNFSADVRVTGDLDTPQAAADVLGTRYVAASTSPAMANHDRSRTASIIPAR